MRTDQCGFSFIARCPTCGRQNPGYSISKGADRSVDVVYVCTACDESRATLAELFACNVVSEAAHGAAHADDTFRTPGRQVAGNDAPLARWATTSLTLVLAMLLHLWHMGRRHADYAWQLWRQGKTIARRRQGSVVAER